MTRYLALYVGPPVPPNASHAGWADWFTKAGGMLVDPGSPTANGITVDGDGQSSAADVLPVRGFSIIQAETRNNAVELVRGHPILQARNYSIHLLELPRA